MFKFNFLVLALCFVFVACSSTKSKTPAEKKAELFYNQGTSDLITKDYTSALKHLLEAYKLSPKESRIANNLGMAYFFKKDNTLAAHYLRKAIELDKENVDARLNLATLRMEQGDLDSAEAEYKNILKVLTYENQYRTYYNLGIIAKKRKNLSEATRYFRQSIEVSPEYCSSHFELGQIALSQQQFDLALAKFKDAGNGVCYDNPEPQYMQAYTMLKLGQYATAKMKLEEVVERFPKSPMANQSRKDLQSLKARLQNVVR